MGVRGSRKLKLQKSSPAKLLYSHLKGKNLPPESPPASPPLALLLWHLKTSSCGWTSQCFIFSNPLVWNRLKRRALGLTFKSRTSILPIIDCSSSTVNKLCSATPVSDFGSHQSRGPKKNFYQLHELLHLWQYLKYHFTFNFHCTHSERLASKHGSLSHLDDSIKGVRMFGCLFLVKNLVCNCFYYATEKSFSPHPLKFYNGKLNWQKID